MTVRDIDTFARYGKDLTNNKTVQWRLLTPVSVSSTIAGITIPIHGLHLDKTMTLKGLNGLQHNVLEVSL